MRPSPRPRASRAPARRRGRSTRSSSPSTRTSRRSAARRAPRRAGRRARRAARGRVRRRRLARRLAASAAAPARRGDALRVAADRALAQLRLVQRHPRRARRSAGDYVAVMAADLQEPVSLVRDFFAALAGGEYDIAVGVRDDARRPAARRRCRRARSGGSTGARRSRRSRAGGVDVFGCTRQVADQLLRMDESHTSLVGLLYWVGFRRVEVPYVRAPRPVGQERVELPAQAALPARQRSSRSPTCPITLIIGLGAIGVAVSTVLGGRSSCSWRGRSGRSSVPGYTPLMLAALLRRRRPSWSRSGSSARTSGGRTRTARAGRARSR